MQDKANNEIAQLTFYLCKEKIDFAGVIDPESSHQHNKTFRQHDFTVDSAQCRFIYFEAESTKSNPTWLDFVNEQLGKQGVGAVGVGDISKGDGDSAPLPFG